MTPFGVNFTAVATKRVEAWSKTVGYRSANPAHADIGMNVVRSLLLDGVSASEASCMEVQWANDNEYRYLLPHP